MNVYTIDHPHNEASALLAVQNRELCWKRGWEVGFWIVSDEKPAGKALAALGRLEKSGQWEVIGVKPRKGGRFTRKRVEDCETLARAGSWMYIFGSQYGSKEGPLEPRRHFVARFNESLLEIDGSRIRTRMDLVRRPFVLHRLINDALREESVDLLPQSDDLQEAFVGITRAKGNEQKKKWAALVQPGDAPVNIEGATFLPTGSLLLGLRYPVSKAGRPILIELEGIDWLFERGEPSVIGVRVISNVGSTRAPAGIRELDYAAGEIHLITGSLESAPEKSVLLQEHAESGRAPNEHWTVPLGEWPRGPIELKGTRIRRFEGGANVEGIALQAGRFWYVHDDERIRLEVDETPAKRRA